MLHYIYPEFLTFVFILLPFKRFFQNIHFYITFTRECSKKVRTYLNISTCHHLLQKGQSHLRQKRQTTYGNFFFCFGVLDLIGTHSEHFFLLFFPKSGNKNGKIFVFCFGVLDLIGTHSEQFVFPPNGKNGIIWRQFCRNLVVRRLRFLP